MDIWNDRLLAFSVSKFIYTGLLEKKIGDLDWNRIPGSDLPKLENAGYVFNGAVIVQCSLQFSSLGNPSYWFVIERDGRRSPAVSYGINSQERIGKAMSFSERRPIIAFIAYNLPSFRDWGSTKKYWTDVWDVPTGQRLLRTKSEKDIYSILFPDGRSLVRLTEKKLEMYVVPDTPVKKK